MHHGGAARRWLIAGSSFAIALLATSPAAAQSRFYAGGTAAIESADRGSIDLRHFPAAGGFAGWHVNERWSIEVQVDRGFAAGRPHGRPGFFGTDTLQDDARAGAAILAVWRSRPIGRLRLAVSMGLSERRVQTTRTVGVDRPVDLPPDDPLLRSETRTTTANGPAGGVLLPIALGSRWSIAPELRIALHFSSDGIYGDGVTVPISAGVRVMWGF